MKLNKIKVIPHQCKRFLSKDIPSAWVLLSREKPLFFGVLFGRGDLHSSKLG